MPIGFIRALEPALIVVCGTRNSDSLVSFSSLFAWALAGSSDDFYRFLYFISMGHALGISYQKRCIGTAVVPHHRSWYLRWDAHRAGDGVGESTARLFGVARVRPCGHVQILLLHSAMHQNGYVGGSTRSFPCVCSHPVGFDSSGKMILAVQPLSATVGERRLWGSGFRLWLCAC